MLLALAGVIAAPLAVLFWLSGGVSLAAAAAAMLAVTLVVLVIGLWLARIIDVAPDSATLAWVLGVFATSAALYALVALGLSASAAAAVWLLVAAVLAWRHQLWRTSFDRSELAGLVLGAAVTLAWCRHSAEAPAVLVRSGVLPVWIDYVVHGGVISSFGDPLAQGAGSIELAGFPRTFYHYASYLLPAALAAPFDLPGLALATSVWLPLGFFTLCAGAYVFGHVLAGATGGVAAVAVLTLLPDAGDYGLRNAFFGFDWHVLTQAGAAYALGIALVTFALLKRWVDERRPRLLAASIALAAGLILFRAHLFVLALPAVLATAALATAVFRRRPLACIGVAVALFVILDLAAGWPRALPAFLATVHSQPGIAYAWYGSIPLGVLLVFPAFLGAFTLLYPGALWLRHRSVFDALPLVLIAGYVAVMVLAPIPSNGDPTELTQRPFVLVYAAVAIWTTAVLVERVRLRWMLAASAAGLIVLWPHSELPKLSWGWNYYARALTPGVLPAAAFLRKEGRPGDSFAVAGLPHGWSPVERPGWIPNDAAAEITALSGMPAYMARPYLQIGQGGERQLVAAERLVALEAVKRESQASAALARLAALGIRWYVVPGNQGPRWDPARRGAVFTDRAVAVYRITSR
jgi:hypothetical protein